MFWSREPFRIFKEQLVKPRSCNPSPYGPPHVNLHPRTSCLFAVHMCFLCVCLSACHLLLISTSYPLVPWIPPLAPSHWLLAPLLFFLFFAAHVFPSQNCLALIYATHMHCIRFRGLDCQTSLDFASARISSFPFFFFARFESHFWPFFVA